MKYCKNCGELIIFDIPICPNCNEELILVKKEEDLKDLSVKYGTLAVIFGLIPLFGFIFGIKGLKLYKVNKNKKGLFLNILGLIIGTISFIFNIYMFKDTL